MSIEETKAPVEKRTAKSAPETRAVKGNEEVGWTDDVLELLRDWRNRAYACQTGHFLDSERCRRWNYKLGIPVVVFSTVVGTTIFSAALESEGGSLKYLLGGISVLAGILGGLQTFLRFSESANKSALAGEWYASIRRDIDETLALPAELRDNPKKCLDAIRGQMNEAGQRTPELSESLWRSVAVQHSVKEP